MLTPCLRVTLIIGAVVAIITTIGLIVAEPHREFAMRGLAQTRSAAVAVIVTFDGVPSPNNIKTDRVVESVIFGRPGHQHLVFRIPHHTRDASVSIIIREDYTYLTGWDCRISGHNFILLLKGIHIEQHGSSGSQSQSPLCFVRIGIYRQLDFDYVSDTARDFQQLTLTTIDHVTAIHRA